jgi:phosphonate transport system permease protein
MEREYPAGWLRPRPRWLEAGGALQKRIAAFLVDWLALAYLWVISAYCYNYIFLHRESFASLTWWIFLVAVTELVVIWESFGLSLGLKLVGLRLKPSDGHDFIARRIRRWLAWHLSVPSLTGLISLIASQDHQAWHDRASGLILVGKGEEARRPWYRASWGIATALLIVLTLIAGLFITKVDLVGLFTGAAKSAPVWRGLFKPNWSLLGEGIGLLIVTIFMALMATILAIPVAVLLSFLAARNLMRGPLPRLIYMIVRVSMSVIRSIEPIVWAIIFVVWVRVGAFPGVLALLVHSIADLTKLYSEQLEAIDPGPLEAITATGANRLQVIAHGIIPQIINPYLSFTLYRWDINVRMATVIGVVGGGGIGQMLYQYTRLWQWDNAGLMVWLIVVIVWAIDYVSSRLRAKLA